MNALLDTEISRYIWESRYRWRDAHGQAEAGIQDSWRRVATAAAGVEPDADHWHRRFLSILSGFRFLPGGRILAGAGTDRHVTLFNCFVMGNIADDMASIFENLKEAALTMQAGGGVGFDFSTLRPRGFSARATANVASGPVSYMKVFDAMCDTLLSTGVRRGAMIASLRCDHPDIEQFIDAKRDTAALTHFNLSVQVSDTFMQAVAADESWALVFPSAALDSAGAHDIVMREWPGEPQPVACVVIARRRARDLWRKMIEANHDSAEPGMLFIDHINAANNLGWCERITCTNPCGEIPLPPYGACNLGSINLTRFVEKPFTDAARFDLKGIADVARVAVRFLDNIIDCSLFPLPEQAEAARASRRIGLGISGLADALLMLGLDYGSDAGRLAAVRVMETICHAAYRTSAQIAAEKGPFPLYDARYLQAPFVRALPPRVSDAIGQRGIRNSHLLAIAPTGTISLLAGNISSGIEPLFDAAVKRRILDGYGNTRQFLIEDYACRYWRRLCDEPDGLPPAFATSATVTPLDQLRMQAALQPLVDNAISKTVTVPFETSVEALEDLYRFAFEKGLKGCTVFREGSGRAGVMERETKQANGGRCCVPA